MLSFLIVMALSGLITGALARLSLPGPDPMSILATIGLGIAGSIIGGLIVYAITDGSYGAGLPVSVACSSVILYLVRRRRGGGLTRPSAPR
ncbi:MAG: GlsB/YeaQ/YmgE family stress response rane protein [Solirubrobacterales bacterium]|nr:GlsB/YeaQ/YmgE family stress response rane protein [Solirubrobacterales bacterium]